MIIYNGNDIKSNLDVTTRNVSLESCVCQLHSSVSRSQPSLGLLMTGSSYPKVLKFDSSGNYIIKWGSDGTEDSQIKTPHGVAIDTENKV